MSAKQQIQNLLRGSFPRDARVIAADIDRPEPTVRRALGELLSAGVVKRDGVSADNRYYYSLTETVN